MGRAARWGVGFSFLIATLLGSILPAAAAGGDLLWQERLDPFAGPDYIVDSASSPSGNTIFVTGRTFGPNDYDILTAAYDGSTGDQLWSSRFDGPLHGYDSAAAVAVGPEGSRVYVTGSLNVPGGNGQPTGFIQAYDAASGGPLWSHQYANRAMGAMAATGDRLYVVGSVDADGSGPGFSQASVTSYAAATGAQQWIRKLAALRYGLSDVAVTPDGSRVFAAGSDLGPDCSPSSCQYPTDDEFFTIAYSSSGSKLWTRRTETEEGQYDGASSIAVAPDGGRLFVTGSVGGGITGVDNQVGGSPSGASVVTVAYKPGGRELWISQLNGLGIPWSFGGFAGSTVAPTGDQAFVSVNVQGEDPSPCPGLSADDVGVVAWDAVTGAADWYATYDSTPAPSVTNPCPTERYDVPQDLTVSPDASRLFVTGRAFICQDPECFSFVQEAIETLAFDPATGQRKWVQRARPSSDQNGHNHGETVSVSADSLEVVVGGDTFAGDTTSGSDWVLLGYDTV
jgi:hypothetical protein